MVVAGVSSAHGQNVLGEILRRMDMNNKSLQSLRAKVTMVKFNSQLNIPDTTIGNTSYLAKTSSRGRYILIDWLQPLEEHVSVIGDDYELWRPRLNQVLVGKVDKAKNSASMGGALSFMSMSKEQLKENFTVIYVGEEQVKGGGNTWHLQLTPKTAANYKMAEIWVDGNGMPVQAKTVENNGDTTTVLLENIVKNETLKGDIFKLKYPSSVKKVRP
ncbi:hypothetical protein BH10ACI2_BH10ACI2_06870 [soil metagenome]